MKCYLVIVGRVYLIATLAFEFLFPSKETEEIIMCIILIWELRQPIRSLAPPCSSSVTIPYL